MRENSKVLENLSLLGSKDKLANCSFVHLTADVLEVNV